MACLILSSTKLTCKQKRNKNVIITHSIKNKNIRKMISSTYKNFLKIVHFIEDSY